MLVGFLLRYVCCRTDMRELQLYIETRTSLRSDESIQCYKQRAVAEQIPLVFWVEEALPEKSVIGLLLCAPLCVLCVSVVVLPKPSLTTETQRTQRVHREETFRAKPVEDLDEGEEVALSFATE